jgi:hypothetical protein
MKLKPMGKLTPKMELFIKQFDAIYHKISSKKGCSKQFSQQNNRGVQ